MKSLLIPTFQAANLLIVPPVYENVCAFPSIILCALNLAMCVAVFFFYFATVCACVCLYNEEEYNS